MPIVFAFPPSPAGRVRQNLHPATRLHHRVEGKNGVNRMGVGARVKVCPAGKLGEAAKLLGAR